MTPNYDSLAMLASAVINQIVEGRFQIVQGDFLMGIRSDNWLAINNLRHRNALPSPDMWEPLQSVSARSLSPEALRHGPLPEALALSPRTLNTIFPAIIIRRGGSVGIGTPPYPIQLWSQGKMDAVRATADAEIAFEEARRGLAPDAACRLACIWLAENSDAAPRRLNKALGADHFLNVNLVAAHRFTRVDMGWFDRYRRQPNPDFIDRYWRGEECTTKDHFWEYLLEGSAVLVENEALRRFRAVPLVLDSPCPPASDPELYREWRAKLRDKRGTLDLECPSWSRYEDEEDARCHCAHLVTGGTPHRRKEATPWCMIHQRAHDSSCPDELFLDYEKRVKRERAIEHAARARKAAGY